MGWRAVLYRVHLRGLLPAGLRLRLLAPLLFCAFSPNSAPTPESEAFILNYQIREDIAVGGKLEWFSDTTKKGYSPLGGSYQSQNNGGTMLTQNRKDDRSHAFFYIRHIF